MFLELINGVALLLALSLLQAFNVRLLHGKKTLEHIISGILFGGICVVGMMNPITIMPGAIFDARSVVLGMSGLFCGPLAAIIAAAIAGCYRIWLGGVDVGIGVAVVIASTLFGLGYRYARDKGWVKTGILQFLVFGFIVHAVAVLLFATFPTRLAHEVMSTIALPYLLIFTPATAFLGLLLQDIEDRRKTELALRQSDARYARVIEGSDQGFWDWNLKKREFNVSPRFETMLGYTAGELSLAPENWPTFVHPVDLAKAMESIDLHCKGLTPSHEMELRLRTKSGEWKWVLTRGKIVAMDDDGNPLLMSGTHTDIAAKREAEAALQESEQKFRQQTQRLEEVIFGTDAGTWEWNVQTDDAVLNARWAEMLGYTLDELLQLCNGSLKRTALAVLVHPDGLKHAGDVMERCFNHETETFDCEVQMQHQNGHWVWVLARGRVVEWTDDGKPLRMSGTHQDITQMKKSEQQLLHIAHFDLLTGLPNRVLLGERLQRAMAQSQRRGDTVAVAYLDLDGFKEVNDRHGHDVGDELLIALAQRMKATMREIDTLARIGGDEFVAVLVDLASPLDCHPALARLLQAASEQVILGDAVLQVSASIGVTLSPQDGADADQLLRHADQAMYLAKQAGKNRYQLFDVGQAAAVEAQRESLDRIRRAMDRHEFVLHYQPKVNMKTGELIGAEALIRWQHPERGLLPPAAFLPIIENHTISVEVGEWVIDSALAQITQWKGAGLDIPVSVNVSARQLQQADFALRLSELLGAHPDVQPNSLELEILETSALEDIKNVSEVMFACRKIGVRFALDDFGTGYSSLTYLKSLPADVLKIDQTFVRDMLDDTDDLAIVEGVMGLANAFRRIAIAEGVETIAHGELLLSLGCELAQGYAIARPMPAADFPGWAASWRPDPAWTAWQDRLLKYDDRMVVYAEVKHRHWQRDIEAYMAGDRDSPPPVDAHAGHFDHWQETEGQERYGDRPGFPAVVALHDRVHALGRELVEMHIAGHRAQAQAGLAELQALREQLVVRLRRLVQGDQSA